jgi:hypothetical protein
MGQEQTVQGRCDAVTVVCWFTQELLILGTAYLQFISTSFYIGHAKPPRYDFGPEMYLQKSPRSGAPTSILSAPSFSFLGSLVLD